MYYKKIGRQVGHLPDPLRGWRTYVGNVAYMGEMKMVYRIVVRRAERKSPPWSSRNKGIYTILDQKKLQVLLLDTIKLLKFQNVFMYTREASVVHGHVIRGICTEEHSCSNSASDPLEYWSSLGAWGDLRDGERLARADFWKASPIVSARVWFLSMTMSVSELSAEIWSRNVIASPILTYLLHGAESFLRS